MWTMITTLLLTSVVLVSMVDTQTKSPKPTEVHKPTEWVIKPQECERLGGTCVSKTNKKQCSRIKEGKGLCMDNTDLICCISKAPKPTEGLKPTDGATEPTDGATEPIDGATGLTDGAIEPTDK
ncbi:unnamed protein product, partial [Meganyctiphanes norvegica]